MSFSKVYYLKEGKLELSMLDEESYESEREEQKNILDENDSSEPQLVVSSQVSKTLHYMGKYLTIKEEEKEKNKYESVITKQDEVSHSKNKKVILFTKTEKDDNLQSVHSGNDVILGSETQDVGTQNTDIAELASEKANDKNDDLSDELSEMKSLNQQNIDSIVEGYFKKCTTTPYQYAKELKEHIDRQIEAIRNYN